MTMTGLTIAVLGGTSSQGGGVVEALLSGGRFRVRVPTRNIGSESARALARRGVELAEADILDARSMRPVFDGRLRRRRRDRVLGSRADRAGDARHGGARRRTSAAQLLAVGQRRPDETVA